MKVRIILYLSIIILLTSIIFLSILLKPLTNNTHQSMSHGVIANEFVIQRERYYWSDLIGKEGSAKAYQEFKEKYFQEYQFGIHYFAHVFGEALYLKEGENGVTTCDSTFAYGCFMGFMISAIKDEGIDIVYSLNDVCVEENGSSETGCRHGIGHGMLQYLGNDQLEKTLNICSSLQEVSPLGCTQGVFMEYNRPSIMNPSKAFLSVRKLENDTLLHEPCASLPKKYLVSCYYEQSQWWVSVLNNDYQKIGLLCNNLSSELVKKSCFMGVGTVVSQMTRYNPKKTIAACNLMPTSLGNIACRSAAAWVFTVNPKYEEKYSLMCEGLNSSDKELCLKDSISPDKVI